MRKRSVDTGLNICNILPATCNGKRAPRSPVRAMKPKRLQMSMYATETTLEQVQLHPGANIDMTPVVALLETLRLEEGPHITSVGKRTMTEGFECVLH